MSEDDDLRRALSGVPRDADAYEALQTLRPRMRRARSRRRATTATIAATLVIGGTAGVMAAMPDTEPAPMRTSMIDDVDDRVETSSTVPTTRSETRALDHATGQPDDPAPSTDPLNPPGATTLAPGIMPEGADGDEAPDPTSAPTTTVKSPTALPSPDDDRTSPPDEGAPAEPPPVAPSLQTINSACGAMVVLIDGGTVRIQATQPLPGFEARVSTDGPESIELVFNGRDGSCELHVELHPYGLEIDVQDLEPER